MKAFQALLDKRSWLPSRQLSEAYLDAFWLSPQELSRYNEARCRVFPEKHFVSDRTSFNPRFDVFRTIGGCTLYKELYEVLQKFMGGVGDQVLIMEQDGVENTLMDDGEPFFNLRYPVTTKWEQMHVKNEGISEVMFGFAFRQFFVYGNSGMWGLYAGNDWLAPLNYWVFAPQLRSMFLELLNVHEIIPYDIKRYT